MKRRVVIEIDCGARRCKECSGDDGMGENGCEVFDAIRAVDSKGRNLRLPACHEAERAYEVLANPLPKLPDEPAGTWGGPIALEWRGMTR